MSNKDLTTQAIEIIQKCPQCLESIKQVPCNSASDFEHRFSCFLRVGKGMVLVNLVDFTKVYNHFYVN